MEATDDSADVSAASATSTVAAGKQFGIAALFWITFVFGLGLSYLRQLDSVEIVIYATVAISIGALVGVVIGLLPSLVSVPSSNPSRGQHGEPSNAQSSVPNAVFWATLIAAFGYISTAADPRYAPAHRLAWAALGATTGGMAATFFKRRLIANVLLCAVVAGAVMGVFFFFTRDTIRSADLRFDVYAAPIIGIAVAFFVQLLMWLERQKSMPRYVTATWLLIAVIVGNLISR